MLLDSIKKAVLRLFPELGAGLHLDRYARIVGINDAPAQGSSSERFRPRYSVDVQILTPDMEPDPLYPVYPAVPLSVPFCMGEESGIYGFPRPGSLAVVGFAYGKPEHPIIRQVYPLGASLPGVAQHDLLLQQGAGVYLKADKNGQWQMRTPGVIDIKSASRVVEAIKSTTRLVDELRTVYGSSSIEIGGVFNLEAGLLNLLSVLKADIGTLGELNLTAGADSTFSTAGAHTETIGKDRNSTVKGSRTGEVAGDDALQVEGSQSIKIGTGQTVEIGTSQQITAGASIANTAPAITLASSGCALAMTGKIKMTGPSGSGGSGGASNLFAELTDCLDAICRALTILSTHTHGGIGTVSEGGGISTATNEANGHNTRIQNMVER